MNLPNFINFEPFNRLRKKMHTDHLGRFSIDRDAPPPPALPAALVTKPEAKPKAAAKTKAKPKTAAQTKAKSKTAAQTKAKPKAGTPRSRPPKA